MRLFVSLIDVYSLAIFVRVVLHWAGVDLEHGTLRVLWSATEPVLAPVRAAVPSIAGLDLSPLVVLVGLQLVARLIHRRG